MRKQWYQSQAKYLMQRWIRYGIGSISARKEASNRVIEMLLNIFSILDFVVFTE